MEPKLRILSLGAGVQSTTLALMAARKELPHRPDFAIFADTGWEPEEVYKHLNWLETLLPFPVLRVRREGKDLGEHAIAIANSPVTRTASPPWFTEGPRGMLPRQCSKEFKVRVIQKEVRRLLGLAPGERANLPPRSVEQWIGISLDEMQRMKRSELGYVENVFPLVDLRMKRRDCLTWMQERQYPTPPKSACIFCPYHGDKQWRDMRDGSPDDWKRAVHFDASIRSGFYGMDGQAYVHRQRVPLDLVDLDTPADKGQVEFGFLQECEGICGV
ncbi:hypothetical protein [Brucella pseudogrignonensis]|uniref:Phosphoadenosine phosphosulfate reductase family protein n=1 Tax=Brucella pseudogrignonensis TaxID=419475 RepID=A0ABU1M5E9_9HYPH|nr:hypothetical protein [Brucella pseudogrignonensis]MDR6431264.1 hypothetical protein [Brucella pseudogrignonensis]